MAVYKTIRYGSRGDDVKELQKLLNNKGHSLSVDGIYGEKTQSAVKQYQASQGLKVDGITGKNTWSALTGETHSQNATGDKDYVRQYEQSRPQYEPSGAVNEAEGQLLSHEAKHPGEYKSAYEDRLKELYDRASAYGEFSYDPSGDPLYERYRDKYVSGGQLAMQDTVAQLAALTGGYANSYAQAAGQQQMNAYMTELNDILPELEERAYSRWADGRDDLYEQLFQVQKLDDAAYDRYRDSVDDYYKERDFLYDRYQDAYENEYEQYLDALGAWQKDRDYYYDREMDALKLAGKSSAGGSSSGKSSSGKDASGTIASITERVGNVASALGDAVHALKERYEIWTGDAQNDEPSEQSTRGTTSGNGRLQKNYALPEEAWANDFGEEIYQELKKRIKEK